MARHRRYPTKKSGSYKDNKILQTQTVVEVRGDELELPRPSKQMERRNRKKNKPPPETMLDDQPTTWRLRELQELKAKIKEREQQQRPKRRKKFKNSLQEQAQRLGYKQRPWEDPIGLVSRISRDTDKAINEEMLKARFAKAGRNVNEIRQEYEAMDRKKKANKERKKMEMK